MEIHKPGKHKDYWHLKVYKRVPVEGKPGRFSHGKGVYYRRKGIRLVRDRQRG